jgi:hypothetical protein
MSLRRVDKVRHGVKDRLAPFKVLAALFFKVGVRY